MLPESHSVGQCQGSDSGFMPTGHPKPSMGDFWVDLKAVSPSLSSPSSPGVSRSLEPVAGQLSSSVATKLTAVEGSMKENISKLLKSKVRWAPEEGGDGLGPGRA